MNPSRAAVEGFLSIVMSKLTIETTADAQAALSECNLPANAPEAAGHGALLVRAPINIDVMGGIAQQTGAMVLRTLSALSVMVAVRNRDDQKLGLKIVPTDPRKQPCTPSREWPLSAFYAAPGLLLGPAELIEKLDTSRAAEKAVISVLHAMISSGKLPHLGGGVNIAIEAPSAASIESIASIRLGTCAGIAKQFDLKVDQAELAAFCDCAHYHFEQRAGGPATHLGSLAGQPGELLQICTSSRSLAGSLEIPDGCALVAIDSGARHQQADEKNKNAWVATLMGQDIIRKIAQSMNGRLDGLSEVWDGRLSHLSVTDYTDLIRDRLPTKVKGEAFIQHFGGIKDNGAEIDPKATYKVRSRAEHHIYESERVRQFAERLGRANRTKDRKALCECGDLMYASHWSYGQRCGLGSIETDQLVNQIRANGKGKGVLGARICGPGGGGCVVTLIEDQPTAHEAIDAAVRAYQEQTGIKAHVFQGGRTGTRPFAIYRIP